MKTKPLLLVYMALGCVWAGLLWGAYGQRDQAAGSGAAAAPDARSQKHYVTPRQLTASGRLIGQPAPACVLTAHDGHDYRLADLARGRPLVLVFLKDGCPCNLDFEPIVRQLHTHYHHVAGFAEVVDGTLEIALSYAEANQTPYQILSDPEQTLIRSLEVENGGYVVLLDRQGVIEKVWPGFSVEMVRELSGRVAKLAGVEAADIDVAGAPAALLTGCPYVERRK